MADEQEKQHPSHIAIVMDGNGRWAQERQLSRTEGHKAGVQSLRKVIKACGQLKLEALTVFAFSSENWQRPDYEVNFLLNLFASLLKSEIQQLHDSNVKVCFIGNLSGFSKLLQKSIQQAHQLTQHNTGLKLYIAANYGGRWDITQAAQVLAEQVAQGLLTPEQITTEKMQQALSLSDVSPPDLLIRTSGEQRVSNFLLWQLAYTELYFTNTLWPDFDEEELALALEEYARRQRRFGSVVDANCRIYRENTLARETRAARLRGRSSPP